MRVGCGWTTPGRHWAYSNTNHVLAGMVVRAVTGRAWADEVAARIVRPLGLHDTYYPGGRAKLPPRAARACQQFAPAGSSTSPVASGAMDGRVMRLADDLMCD